MPWVELGKWSLTGFALLDPQYSMMTSWDFMIIRSLLQLSAALHDLACDNPTKHVPVATWQWLEINVTPCRRMYIACASLDLMGSDRQTMIYITIGTDLMTTHDKSLHLTRLKDRPRFTFGQIVPPFHVVTWNPGPWSHDVILNGVTCRQSDVTACRVQSQASWRFLWAH